MPVRGAGGGVQRGCESSKDLGLGHTSLSLYLLSSVLTGREAFPVGQDWRGQTGSRVLQKAMSQFTKHLLGLLVPSPSPGCSMRTLAKQLPRAAAAQATGQRGSRRSKAQPLLPQAATPASPCELWEKSEAPAQRGVQGSGRGAGSVNGAADLCSSSAGRQPSPLAAPSQATFSGDGKYQRLWVCDGFAHLPSPSAQMNSTKRNRLVALFCRACGYLTCPGSPSPRSLCRSCCLQHRTKTIRGGTGGLTGLLTDGSNLTLETNP